MTKEQIDLIFKAMRLIEEHDEWEGNSPKLDEAHACLQQIIETGRKEEC